MLIKETQFKNYKSFLQALITECQTWIMYRTSGQLSLSWECVWKTWETMTLSKAVHGSIRKSFSFLSFFGRSGDHTQQCSELPGSELTPGGTEKTIWGTKN